MEILERNKICPVCGESRTFTREQFITMNNFYGVEHELVADSWYGKHDETRNLLAFFRFWKRSHFQCHTCGCEWETEPYPTNIINYK